MNAKTLQGADCGSAHELICPCMDAYQTEEKSERKTCIEIRRQQHLWWIQTNEIKDRFEALSLVAGDKEPDELANDIAAVLLDTTEKHLPRVRKIRQPWTGPETLEKIDERREY